VSGLVRRIDERAGRWVRLVLDAPPGNLLSLAMVADLDLALDALAGARGLRWLTIEGAGGEFSFGAKIQEHLPEPMREVLPATMQLVRRWLALPVPTAALVEGRCLGGGFELALCCDDILAAADATFGLPEVKVGAFPPVGALLLPLRVGASRASRAVVTGQTQSANAWQAAGLVSVSPPDSTLIESARGWFDTQFAGQSAVALAHACLAARAVVRAQVEPLLAQLERRYLEELLATHDAAEGVRAWMEKRAPRWEDR
jgi:cyclohexa-1,5-dienecarbonyl-CoA hydratase